MATKAIEAGGIVVRMEVPDTDLVNYSVRFFVLADDGLTSFDPAIQSFVTAAEFDSLDEFSEAAAFGQANLPEEGAKAPWERLVDVLRKERGITTDVETLRALPLRFYPVGQAADELT